MSSVEFLLRIALAMWIGGCFAALAAVLFREAQRLRREGRHFLVLFISAGALLAGIAAAWSAL